MVMITKFYFFFFFFFFFKQKTAYEMLLCDWSSDVCSSDLPHDPGPVPRHVLERSWLGSGRSLRGSARCDRRLRLRDVAPDHAMARRRAGEPLRSRSPASEAGRAPRPRPGP